METMNVARIAAFSDRWQGGNPAGVMIAEVLPEEADMQRIAADVGYSETAFLAPQGEGWRIRYFAPEIEVPFCGHATIAAGAVLATRFGAGTYRLFLNTGEISVEGNSASGLSTAALTSPPTRSEPAPAALVAEALALFGWQESDLDARLPPAWAEGGARHLVLALHDRDTLRAMQYDQAQGKAMMAAHGITTFCLVHAESPTRFHARNPFAIGGVYEDPATGAAAAALGGYLRDIGWPHGGEVEIIQGEDMGVRSLLNIRISDEPGGSIRVAGMARPMDFTGINVA